MAQVYNLEKTGKYNIPLNHMEFDYIRSCTNIKELEKIFLLLRSGDEGRYPDLELCCEERIKLLSPNSRVLRKEVRVPSISEIDKQQQEELKTEMQDFLSTVQLRDNSLKDGHIEANELQPIRSGATGINGTEEKLEKDKSKKTVKPRDFSEWEKFDVDKALEDVDCEREKKEKERNVDKLTADIVKSSSEEINSLNAVREKEKGNEAFKANDFEEAITYYSRSISFSPLIASYNNRALVYLKLSKWDECIKDCEHVLQQKDDDVKALLRRASAYKGKKEFSKAMVDLKKVLHLEENNKWAKDMVADIEKGKKKGKRMVIKDIEGSEDEEEIKSVVTSKTCNNSEETRNSETEFVATYEENGSPKWNNENLVSENASNGLCRAGKEVINESTKVNVEESEEQEYVEPPEVINESTKVNVEESEEQGYVKPPEVINESTKVNVEESEEQECVKPPECTSEKTVDKQNLEDSFPCEDTTERHSVYGENAMPFRMKDILKDSISNTKTENATEFLENNACSVSDDRKQTNVIHQEPDMIQKIDNQEILQTFENNKVPHILIQKTSQEPSSRTNQPPSEIPSSSITLTTAQHSKEQMKQTSSNEWAISENDHLNLEDMQKTQETCSSEDAPESSEQEISGSVSETTSMSNVSQDNEATSGVPTCSSISSSNKDDDDIAVQKPGTCDITNDKGVELKNGDSGANPKEISQMVIVQTELPSHVAELKKNGNNLFRKGQYWEALQKYSEAIGILQDCKRGEEQTFNLSILYSNRAMCSLKLGDCQSSIKDCTESLNLVPHSVKQLLRRAAANEMLERYRLAYVDYKHALVIDSSIHLAYEGSTRCSKVLIESDGLKWREKLPQIPKVSLLDIPKIETLTTAACTATAMPSAHRNETDTSRSVSNLRTTLGHGSATEAVKSNLESADPASRVNGTTQKFKSVEEQFEDIKTRGNKHVKEGEFQQAILCYGQCLELVPGSVVCYTNRSLCHIKVNQFQDAANDCTQALQTEINNIKALFRRAQARKMLKQYRESLEDLTHLLKVDPMNNAAKRELELVKGLWRQELNVMKNLMNVDNQAKEKKQDGIGKKEKKPRKRVSIQVVDGDAKEQKPQELTKDCLKQKKVESAQTNRKKQQSEKECCSDHAGHSIPKLERATPYEFLHVWNSLKSSDGTKCYAELLRQITPEDIPRVISNKLDGIMLSLIIQSVAEHFADAENAEFGCKVLQNLAKVPRFNTVVMFMSRKEKTGMKTLLKKLSENSSYSADDMKALRSQFGV